jgi:ParB-like chromosome segregation protein Spo0J
MARRSELLTPKSIVVEDGRLPIVESHVDALAASIKEIGLLEPIIVIRRKKLDPPIILVAGRHRLAACLKLKMEAVNCIVENEESPAVEQWRALAEIDENLIRRDLTAGQRAELVGKRKAAADAERETKHGGARGSSSQVEKRDRSTVEIANKTGRSVGAVARDATRAKALGTDLRRVIGTSLDKGAELDALSKLTPNERGPIIDRAVNGENVSALRGVGAVEPTAAAVEATVKAKADRAANKTPKPVPDVKPAADRAEQAAAGAQVSQELIEARKEIERLKSELVRVQRGGLPRTHEEWLERLRVVKEAEKMKRAAARAVAKEVAAEKYAADDEPTLQEKLLQAEKQLAANKTRIWNLTGQLRYLRHWYAKEVPVIMSLETFGKVSRCLRQDHGPPTEAERDDALKLLNLWRSEQKKTGGLFSASDADATEAGT